MNGTGTRGGGANENAGTNGSPPDDNSSPGINPNNPAVRHAIRTAEVEREVVSSTISETLGKLNEADRFIGYLSALEAVGWDLSISMLEVRAGKRVFVDEHEVNK